MWGVAQAAGVLLTVLLLVVGLAAGAAGVKKQSADEAAWNPELEEEGRRGVACKRWHAQ